MKRTPEQEVARRLRQINTAKQPNCARCRNKAPINDSLCGGCRDQADNEAIAENQVANCVERVYETLDNAGVMDARNLSYQILQLIEAVIAKGHKQ